MDALTRKRKQAVREDSLDCALDFRVNSNSNARLASWLKRLLS